MADTGLNVKVFADARDFQRGMTSAKESLGGLDTAMRQTQTHAGGLKSAFSQLGAVAGGLIIANVVMGIGKAVASAFPSSVEMASNLSESINKVGVVFATTADEIIEFSKTSAISMGLSQKNTLEYTASLGYLFKAVGATDEVMTENSKTLVKRAADIASLNNLDPTEVLEKMRAGLIGEAEPLRAVGVLLTENRVAQEAVNLGLATSIAVVSDAAKMQARYSLIMKDSNVAAGDFINTSDGLANAGRIIGASWENLQTKLGAAFIPAAQQLFNALQQGLAGLDTWLTDNKATLDIWSVNIAAAVSVAIEAIGAIASGFAQGLGAALEIVIGMGQAIWAALQWINPFAEHSRSLVDSVDAGITQIIGAFGSLTAINTPLVAAGDAVVRFRELASGALEAIEGKTDAMVEHALARFGEELPAAYRGAMAAIDNLRGQLPQLGSAISAQTQVVRGLENQIDTAKAAIAAKERAIKQLEAGMRTYEDATDSAKSAVERQREAVERAKTGLDNLKSALSDAQSELRRFSEAPIKGTREFEDALFGIEQQTNKAQLQLTRLKIAGAPAEQIKAVEDELAGLRLKADELKLEERIKFDPLKKQVEALAKPVKELTFDEIIKGIKGSQASITSLEAQITPATKTWENQKEALKGTEAGLKAAQDRQDAYRRSIEDQRRSLDAMRDSMSNVQVTYDLEKQKLADMKENYRAVTQQVKDWERALADIVRLSDEKDKKEKAAAKGTGAGTGVAAAGASQAQLNAAKAAAAEMKEKIATASKGIQNALKPIDDFFKGLFKGLKSIGDGMKAVGDGTNPLIVSLTGLADTVSTNVLPILTDLRDWFVPKIQTAISDARKEWDIFWADIEPTIGPAMTTIQNLMGEFKNFWDGHWTDIQRIFDGVWTMLSGALRVNWLMITGIITVGLALLAGDWTRAWNGIRDTVTRIWTTLTGMIDAQLGIINQITGGWFPILAESFTRWLTGMRDMFAGVWAGINQIAGGQLAILGSRINLAWSSISWATTNTWNAIVGAVGGLMGLLGNTIGAAMGSIGGLVGHTWSGIQNTISGVLESIASNVSSMMTHIQWLMSTAWASVTSTVVNTWAGVQSTVSSTLGNIAGNVSSMMTHIQWLMSTAWASVTSTAANTWDTILSTLQSWWSGAEAQFRSIGESVGTALMSAMRGAISSISIPLPTIAIGYNYPFGPSGIGVPYLIFGVVWRRISDLLAQIGVYASGTDFYPGGLGLVGERGPELVELPRGSRIHPAGETAGLMGRGITVSSLTINNPPERSAEQQLMRALRRMELLYAS